MSARDNIRDPEARAEARIADSDPEVFYTRVIVHAHVPAGNADEAVGKLCDAVRAGIGPEGPVGREWGTAIAASIATSPDGTASASVNEEFMRRFAADRAGP